MEPRPHRAPRPSASGCRRNGDHSRVQRSRERRRHDQEPARPDHATRRDHRRGRLLDRRDGRRSPRARRRGGPTADEHRLQGRRSKFRTPLRPHAPDRCRRRRYDPRAGRPGLSAARVSRSGRRGGVRLRAAAAGAQRVGAGTLHRVSVRLHLLQAAPGVLRKAAHFLWLFLYVSHRHPASSPRLVEPNPRRGCRPDLEPVPSGPCRAVRAGSRLLSNRASHPHADGNAAAALVTRVRSERQAPLARPSRRALSAFGCGGRVLGCDDRRRGLPGAPASPRAPPREALDTDRVRDRCPCGNRAGPRRRRTATRDPPRDREHPRVLRAANRQRGVLSARGLRRAAARAVAARVREGALTMAAGLPGTGIGGMFYLISALATPLREGYLRLRGRKSRGWRLVVALTAIAGAILAGLWATSWLLGLALSASRRLLPTATAPHPGNLLPALALLISVGAGSYPSSSERSSRHTRARRPRRAQPVPLVISAARTRRTPPGMRAPPHRNTPWCSRPTRGIPTPRIASRSCTAMIPGWRCGCSAAMSRSSRRTRGGTWRRRRCWRVRGATAKRCATMTMRCASPPASGTPWWVARGPWRARAEPVPPLWSTSGGSPAIPRTPRSNASWRRR